MGVTNWRKPHFGVFLRFLAHIFASSHLNVLNFTYVIGSTLSTTSRKTFVLEKFASGCILGTRNLFLRLSHFFRIFIVFTHNVSSDAVIWATWNLDSMYSIYNYLKIKNIFCRAISPPCLNGVKANLRTSFSKVVDYYKIAFEEETSDHIYNNSIYQCNHK